jgi:hypothetical protein
MAGDERNAEIRIDKIPVRGGVGAVLIIILVSAVMLVELPALRWPILLGVLGGVVLGGVLIFRRRLRRQ